MQLAIFAFEDLHNLVAYWLLLLDADVAKSFFISVDSLHLTDSIHLIENDYPAAFHISPLSFFTELKKTICYHNRFSCLKLYLASFEMNEMPRLLLVFEDRSKVKNTAQLD